VLRAFSPAQQRTEQTDAFSSIPTSEPNVDAPVVGMMEGDRIAVMPTLIAEFAAVPDGAVESTGTRAWMSTTTTDFSHLDHVDNVADGYRHVDKVIEPAEDLALPTSHLKWYDVRRPEAVIGEDVRADARAFLTAEVAAGRLAIAGELGFTILHLCGDSFYFLIVCTWRNDNEMWQTGYARDTREGGPFTLVPQATHLQVICVWELGAVLHEREAWTRYLRSARHRSDKIAYLADQFSGTA
jgi:hypothetical protein